MLNVLCIAYATCVDVVIRINVGSLAARVCNVNHSGFESSTEYQTCSSNVFEHALISGKGGRGRRDLYHGPHKQGFVMPGSVV